VRSLVSPGRDHTWLLAFATLSLGASVWFGRYQGHAISFIAGFFLGLSLAISVFYLVLTATRGTVLGNTP
jgi:hypothetical protein